MDEKGKDLRQEDNFSLEDIMKEFGHGEDYREDDVQIWNGYPTDTADSAKNVPEDTVRLDEITRAVKKLEESDATMRFTPVSDGEPEEDVRIVPEPEEKVEPFSDGWEPEYEQPIGEYVPPEPIVFRPKSRLMELKRKLIEGPEKRYYELAEQGSGKLQAAIFLNLLVTLAAAGSTAMYAFGMVQPERIRLLAFVQFLALLLSALLGSYQLIEGFTDLIHKRFSINSLLLFSLLACLADAMLSLQQVRVSCCAVFSLNMTMSLWGTYQKRNIEMSQMDTLRKAVRLNGLSVSPDYYENRSGILRTEGKIDDFMDHYKAPSGTEKTLNVYALVALLVGLGIGVTAGVRHSLELGLQAFCAALLVATPASVFVTLSRPMALLQRRLHKLGTVICGWQGVRELSKPAMFPLTDADMFPTGSAKMNGVKFYGTRDTDEVVAYATALITAGGGSMAPLFSQLLESRSGYHYEAKNLQSYPGGIGAEVNGEAVLAGSLSFMQSMGVEMPAGTKVKQAVYVAVDGTLSGVFAITYAKMKSSATGLTTLCAYRGLTPVLTTGDFILTESFLRGKFGVNTRRIAFPPRDIRMELAAREPAEDAPSLALMTRDGLAGAAYAVTGARALRSASIAGVVVHLLGGILGLLAVLALAIVGADYLLTPANLFLYELIWMIPGMLITEWTRSV